MEAKNQTKEQVVLVDENNNITGAMSKSEVHGENTPLHRGFSAFLFNKEKKLLLQKRSRKKKTWPSIWSNSCCGHPAPGESNIVAAERRIKFELGIGAENLKETAPYRYQFIKDGIIENEICPILIGIVNSGSISANPDEVEEVKWADWREFLRDIKKFPKNYTPWCVEEAEILENLLP